MGGSGAIGNVRFYKEVGVYRKSRSLSHFPSSDLQQPFVIITTSSNVNVSFITMMTC